MVRPLFLHASALPSTSGEKQQAKHCPSKALSSAPSWMFSEEHLAFSAEEKRPGGHGP